jgi:hypothetical protein
MFVSSISDNSLILSGRCPHCRRDVALNSVTTLHLETLSNVQRRICACRCISCHKYILAITKQVLDGNHWVWAYESHCPLGSPNDNVSEHVPDGVREDFREALRCRWIDAFKAAVLMCRRSLQASCDREHAAGNDLFTQIDDLAAKQRITEPLKKMAHRIRLLGKRGAHGDYSDIDDSITEKDANDAITFMNHYMDHVYVLPAQLEGKS